MGRGAFWPRATEQRPRGWKKGASGRTEWEGQVRKIAWGLSVERTEFQAKQFSFIQYILFSGWLIF